MEKWLYEIGIQIAVTILQNICCNAKEERPKIIIMIMNLVRVYRNDR